MKENDVLDFWKDTENMLLAYLHYKDNDIFEQIKSIDKFVLRSTIVNMQISEIISKYQAEELRIDFCLN